MLVLKSKPSNRMAASMLATLALVWATLTGTVADWLTAADLGVAPTSASTWGVVGAVQTPRLYHTSTVLPSGKVLITGGSNTGNASLASCEVYDPTRGAWSLVAPLRHARKRHAAVLMHSGKVLVTGGQDDIGLLGSSEIYDPVTNTWTSTAAQLAVRMDFCSTLLANGKVLVNGGFGPSGTVASSEVFDPATGTWSASGALAAARIYHASALLPNGKVLAIGGFDYTDKLKTCELYDPVTGTWSATGQLLVKRRTLSATVLANGKVLVTGGEDSSGITTTSELYDPAAGTWAASGSLSGARMYHTSTLLPSGRVLIAGGFNGSSPLTTCELFNPSTGIWSTATALTSPRSWPYTALLPTGKVLIIGGSGLDNNPVADCEVYDPAAATWGAAAAMTASRTQHTATLLSSGKVLVVGGRPSSNDSVGLPSCALYDPQANTWSATGSLNGPRFSHVATLLASGKVLVSGGQADAAISGFLSTCEVYDPGTGSWSATGAMVIPRVANQGMWTLLPSGRVLVTGGPGIAHCEWYDPVGGVWSSVNSMSTPRYGHTATLLTTGKVLVAGGYGTGVTFWDTQQSSCELFDPQTATWSYTGSLAMTRDLHAGILLPSGRVLVVGGRSHGWARTLTSEIYDPVSATWSTSGSINEGREIPNAVLLPSGSVLVTSGYGANDISELATVSSETYDPMAGTWTLEPGTFLPRRGPTTTLLATGRVLETGGIYDYNVLSSCRLYDVGMGYDPANQPTITSLAASRPYASTITLTGTLFKGRSEASSGMFTASPTNYPLVRIFSATNGQQQWLSWNPSSSLTSTTVTTRAITGFPPGPAFIQVIVNGIPSAAKAITITRVNPTITWATPSAITYGTALPVSKLNATANVPGTFVYTPTAGTKLAAGSQTLTVTFTPTDGVGYATVSTSVSLTVNNAALSVTANGASRAYGAANPGFTGTVTGVIAGDTITGTYASSATPTTAIGVYGAATAEAITPTLVDPENKLGNYTVTSTKGTLTITQSALTITAVDATMVAGQSVPTLTATAVGLISPDTLANLDTPPSITTTATSASPAGTYPITVSGAVDANYAITFVAGNLTVTAAPGGSGGDGNGGGGSCGLGAGLAALAFAMMLLMRFSLARRDEHHLR